MTKQVRRRRGSTALHSTFTGALGELTVDTDKNTAVIHDESTVGGFPVMRDGFSNYDGSLITNLNVGSVNTAPLGGYRNYIHNGSFDIWQRGTTFNSSTTVKCADRWWMEVAASATQQAAKHSLTFEESELLNVSNAIRIQTSVEPAEMHSALTQAIEYPLQLLSGKTLTASFWVNSPHVPPGGTDYVSVFLTLFFGTGGSTPQIENIGTYRINQADTWERKTFTFTVPNIFTPTLKTIGTEPKLQFSIRFPNKNLTTLPNHIYYTGIQLEDGPVATEFEYRSIAKELILCQRYFNTSYNFMVPAGTATQRSGSFSSLASGSYVNQQLIRLIPPMRVAPVVTLYNTYTGASGSSYSYNTTNTYNISAFSITEKQFLLTTYVPGTDEVDVHWAADAEYTLHTN